MAYAPPPPPPSVARRGRGGRPECKYGKACYNKEAYHLARFAHPWLEEGSDGSPPGRSHQDAAMRRLGTPPRENDLMPPSTPTPRRDRSPRPEMPGALSSPTASSAKPRFSAKPKCRYGKDCYRKDPEHFDLFDHDGLVAPSSSPRPAATTSPGAGSRSPRPGTPERPKLPEVYRAAFATPSPPSAPTSPPARPVAASTNGSSAANGSYSGGSSYSHHGGTSGGSHTGYGGRRISPRPAASAADAGTPRGAPPETPAKVEVSTIFSKDRGDGDGPGRWGHRAGAAGGTGPYTRGTHASTSTPAGSYAGGGAYSSAPGTSYGGGYHAAPPKAAGVKYGYGHKSSRVAPEESGKSDKSDKSMSRIWQDKASKFTELMSGAREKGGAMVPKNVVGALQASVGFIWTINAILLFAAIVKIAG